MSGLSPGSISGLNQCKLLSCSNGQDCDIDKQGITNCVCSHNCEPIVRPVCANDGNTYDSLCEMQKFGCQKRLNIAAKYFGICGISGIFRGVSRRTQFCVSFQIRTGLAAKGLAITTQFASRVAIWLFASVPSALKNTGLFVEEMASRMTTSVS